MATFYVFGKGNGFLCLLALYAVLRLLLYDSESSVFLATMLFFLFLRPLLPVSDKLLFNSRGGVKSPLEWFVDYLPLAFFV